MKYILTFGGVEFVETYDIANKEVTVSESMKDAKLFNSKSEAEYVADRLACDVSVFVEFI